MMMRPDDFEKLLFIARVFLITGIFSYALKLGHGVYNILKYAD